MTRKKNKKNAVNHGRVIQASSQNSACLWDETEAERKSSRGRGTREADNAWHRPKTACSPRVKKENVGHSLISKASQAGLISVTARAEVPLLWNTGNPADLVMECVVVTFVICTFMCVLQF